jgi:hypothetical protein
MAKVKYKTLSSDSRAGTHQWLVDNVSDLDGLRKEVGSAALVANTGDVYICNNAKEWVKL